MNSKIFLVFYLLSLVACFPGGSEQSLPEQSPPGGSSQPPQSEVPAGIEELRAKLDVLSSPKDRQDVLKAYIDHHDKAVLEQKDSTGKNVWHYLFKAVGYLNKEPGTLIKKLSPKTYALIKDPDSSGVRPLDVVPLAEVDAEAFDELVKKYDLDQGYLGRASPHYSEPALVEALAKAIVDANSRGTNLSEEEIRRLLEVFVRFKQRNGNIRNIGSKLVGELSMPQERRTEFCNKVWPKLAANAGLDEADRREIAKTYLRIRWDSSSGFHDRIDDIRDSYLDVTPSKDEDRRLKEALLDAGNADFQMVCKIEDVARVEELIADLRVQKNKKQAGDEKQKKIELVDDFVKNLKINDILDAREAGKILSKNQLESKITQLLINVGFNQVGLPQNIDDMLKEFIKNYGNFNGMMANIKYTEEERDEYQRLEDYAKKNIALLENIKRLDDKVKAANSALEDFQNNNFQKISLKQKGQKSLALQKGNMDYYFIISRVGSNVAKQSFNWNILLGVNAHNEHEVDQNLIDSYKQIYREARDARRAYATELGLHQKNSEFVNWIDKGSLAPGNITTTLEGAKKQIEEYSEAKKSLKTEFGALIDAIKAEIK